MAEGELLERAMNGGAAEAGLRPVPEEVAELLRELGAPPRLGAHLRAVHEVACQVVDGVVRLCPELEFDAAAVRFGAATHDIGKVLHPAELSGPGSAHEEAGRALLLAHGVAPELARFAGTHGSWAGPGVGMADLLVSAADKVWKDKRVAELDDLVVARLAAASGRDVWAEFLAWDDLMASVGEGAGARLAFQAAYPVR